MMWLRMILRAERFGGWATAFKNLQIVYEVKMSDWFGADTAEPEWHRS